jgi:hypothetical protein
MSLLKNPTLCIRSAVEVAASDTGSTDSGGSTSPINPIGKREHGRAQNEDKESRRRMTESKVLSLLKVLKLLLYRIMSGSTVASVQGHNLL